jgi:hypothetical protein
MRLSKLTTTPEHIKNYNLVYRLMLQDPYKKTRLWQFVGYRCQKCDRVIKNDTTIPSHTVSCKKPLQKYRLENPDVILNLKRESWEPFEMNQVYQNNDNQNNITVLDKEIDIM